ncbi:MAG TPA: carboxypeptidase-like regulatory domain-containing protein [Saprospiraceae bacterium]|nr:carboxypeptidase-like regulatory domain-containing protein [Saprospiraceae bacterium]
MAAGVKAFFILPFMWLAHIAIAQQTLPQTVDFECSDCLPSDALVNLSRQTGVNIVFSERFFSQCDRMDIHVRGASFVALIEQISACAKVSFKVIDNQIVFFRKTSKYTLSGYVQDAETGERLMGASIKSVSEKNIGAISNEFGFFSLKLEEGEQKVTVTLIGYRNQTMNVLLNGDRFATVKLRASISLPEVVISSLPGSEGSMHRVESQHYLPVNEMRSLPMPGGEADLLRMAALQPGIQTGVDGVGGLHVRGGNADQNLILLDDVPVYNPGHALGLFSIFNPSMVSNARMWKGDFPARYGGRASSVVDVRTRDGDLQEYHVGASAGLFASSLTAEGPIVRDRSAFLVAGRITYLEPWIRFFSKRGNLITFSGDNAGYRFYDLNAKLNYLVNDRNRLYFSYYYGGDVFQNEFEQYYNDPEGYQTDHYRLNTDWGNQIAAFRWNHVMSKNLFVNSTLRYSRFTYQSQMGYNSTFLYSNGKQSTLADYGLLYQTFIRDWSGKADFTYYPDDRVTLRWGGSYTLHDFRPGAISVNFLQPGQSPISIDSLANLLDNNERLGADEAEGYIDAEIVPVKNWRIEAGINASMFTVKNTNYQALLPRFKVHHSGPGGWSQWAGYHKNTQYLHQIGSFNISLPFELWVPSTQKVPPEQVWQLTAGLGRQRRGWGWQVEGYYKRFDRVLTFLTSNDALVTGGAEDASGWEDRIAVGEGESRGVEFTVEKTTGSTTGSIAYTLSEATRQFPEINSGQTFPFRYDRRHDLKITVHQRINSWLDADLVWIYATGNPITLTGVKYTHQSPDNDIAREVFVFTEVNGYRLPQYHRLDLALNAHFMTGRAWNGIQLGVYNVYNRYNPFYLYVDARSGVEGRAIQYTLLPILPSFRYEIKF